MTTTVSSRSAAVHPTRQQLDELDALLQRMLDLPVNQVDEAASVDESAPSAAEFRPPVSYKVPIAEPPPRLEPRVVSAEEPPHGMPSRATPPPAVAQASASEPGPDDWVRLASTWQPSAQTWQPLAQSWQQAARTNDRPVATGPAMLPPRSEPPPAAVTVPMPAVPPAPPAPNPDPTATRAEQSLEDLIVPQDPRPSRSSAAVAPQGASSPRASIPWWQWPLVPVNLLFDVATLALGPFGTGLRSNIGRNLLAAIGICCFAAAVAVLVADGIGWLW